MSEWKKINTEEDIEDFLNQTYCMHDAAIIALEYHSGYDVKEDGTTQIPYDGMSYIRLTVGSCWFGKVEMFFGGVKYFCSGNSSDMMECNLSFRRDLLGRTRDDRLIVWTDGVFRPEIYGTKIELGPIDLRTSMDTHIIAYELYWRLLSDTKSPLQIQ